MVSTLTYTSSLDKNASRLLFVTFINNVFAFLT